MIWRLLICFNAATLAAASLTGTVDLRQSHDQAVRKHHDFSGVALWLEPDSGPPLHSPSPANAVIKQRAKSFTPHIIALEAGGSVDFPNLDPIFHSAFSNYDGKIFDLGLYAPHTSRAVRFDRPGIVRVFCNIHAAMSAVIVVVPTPYFAVTNPAGTFQIDGLPPGKYRLRVFHERATPEALQLLERSITIAEPSLSLPPLVLSEQDYIPAPHRNKYGKEYRQPPSDGRRYP